MAPDQADRRLRLPQRCAAFWVPDQNAPARGFLAQARSAANAATAARRTPREGLRATEVWVPDQTSGAQAPFFGGLLGPTVQSALRAMPPQFASRVRGHQAHVVLGSRPKQRPSLLGLSARSALTRDARAGCASRARGQRPLPVCPSPASFVRRFVRAECSGVLRHSPGRVGGACLGKKQVGAGCDMRVFSAQPKAGTLPGVP